ncbi:SpvB/TcaC N-terminal domain-containing protein [Pseudomonas sp. H3(2019)]|uniref:SpvB/TcaC N-terminal domain-containing protein n=1 Tax=Pseudomonas sp. H3(2019) TaxID=2598724 RepID=UPI001197D600|nr:SpvB/TcaC N-terminal domain-containing protein [Pseudomonas sp. H3(2019)]TVT84559.1 toxin [Pseudomonas sp. H3(2019)]
MSEQTALPVSAPSLPKGGGAIQSIGKGMGAIGSHGAASYELALPISPGRGFAPSLSLSYGSSVGNGVFGIGWGMSLPAVARRTSKGVPAYTEDDEIVGPNGVVWMPERDSKGAIIRTDFGDYNDLKLGTTYTVVRHFPRVESTFERIEHWSSESDKPGFWLVHGADGSLHLYGKSLASRRVDPQNSTHVGEWLLEESLNAHGEHILYQYKADSTTAQRYLSHVSYGNFKADAHLYLWQSDRLNAVQWHFELLFDYGERNTGYEQKPAYTGQQWQSRSDGFSSFAYGFEIRTERLCRQVLMFHRFPVELGTAPVLVRRLLLDYRQTPLGYHHLSAAHDQAYSHSTTADNHPPVEFSYNEFKLSSEVHTWQPFQNMPALNDGERYQLVDLYGEGLPGVLHSSENTWYYREPLRAKANSNEVTYDQWRALPTVPSTATAQPLRPSLSDLTGDGRLDWVIARPGLNGFFSQKPDRSWSDFATLDAFPTEFFNPQGQLADLMGEGLSDLTLIGPRSIRLYANQREKGFGAAREVAREEDEDALPSLTSSSSELVAFSDVLGSGQPHLVRIRHNEVKCWPNLGRGRFGKGIELGSPKLDYETFDASRIRLADLDGSGAADLIYLHADHAQIFMNRCGNGFDRSIALPWPEGVRYDRFCQVSVADLQGLGCSSLILSVPHMAPRHWRYDFISEKPYLLTGTHNNMGATGSIRYRSSAQEWLDEKAEKIKAGKPLTCHVPFALHLVSKQTQLDEITDNRLTQSFSYRQGYYDGIEREFRGFGLLRQTDSETNSGDGDSQSFTMPCLKKSWFHTGQAVDLPRTGYHSADKDAVALGKALLCQYQPETESDTLITSPDTATTLEMARALSGHLLRSETLGIDKRLKTRTLYSVQENRYRVRLLQPPGGSRHYARMLPLPLESIRYQYEGIADDPQCQHILNLQHDRYGALTHGVNVHYARRKTASDTPPFRDVDQQQWWRDAHDPAQQFYYLGETRAEFIHLDSAQGWRLGLPYRQRTNALQRPKVPEAEGLDTKDITYEKLIELVKDTSWTTKSVLTGLSVQRYKHTSSAETLPGGVAHFEALPDHLETAELDETALKAYDVLSQATRPKGKLLERSGYHRMSDFLPASTTARKLWSVKSAFVTYALLEGFYRPQTLQASKSLGLTEVSYDNHHCFISGFKLPDGCVTKVTYDYRSLLPLSVTDPNGNVQEALVDAFGQVLATSVYSYKGNTLVGFKPVAEYKRLLFKSPADAIKQDKDALQDAATATWYAPFSWMGCVSTAALADTDWLARCVVKRDLLPTGHICASARARLRGLQTLSADEVKLKNELDASTREPVHIAVLIADRFPDDDQRQIRISVTDFDGFGRTLQHKQKVEPGVAYVVNDQGQLTLDGSTARQQVAAQRWRVSERVEYNNKGLAIRTYRPYFADQHRYINDVSLRHFGHCDLQFYDPLGRPTHTQLAKQGDRSYMRRHTRHPWYTVDEDENDTLEEITPKEPSMAGGDA